MILSLHAFKIPLTNLTPRALASSLFPPINLSLSATFIFFSASLLCFFCLLSSLCLVLFPLSHSHIYTNAHTPFAYPPPAPEVCEVVGACESRHTERGSCVPHLKPFAQSMLSASIWICVCVCPCVRLYLFTCQWPGVVEGNVCVSASLALKEKLYFCTHMWARPCGAPLCSYSRSLHCGHIFFIWLWSLCVHTKQGLCRVRVPCYLLSAWKRAALRKLPLKEPFVSHLKRNLCIRCVTKEF